jgi:pimeloyl-ACP methyl ester carboxylesterase
LDFVFIHLQFVDCLRMKIYCFSGLGADKRVFQFLELDGHELIHIDWIEPSRKESLQSYALRLAKEIDSSHNFGLMGLSFGGMIAVEIAKSYNPEKVILISSAKSTMEIPRLYQYAGKFRLPLLIPNFLIQSSNFMTNYFFGAKNERTKIILKSVLKDTNPSFARWAMQAVTEWNSQEEIDCFHIHGGKDRILPLTNSDVDYSVKDGGHLMVLENAEEVSVAISNYLK